MEGQEAWSGPVDPLEDDDGCRPCGCPHDGHLADCPIITSRFDDPPELDDDWRDVG